MAAAYRVTGCVVKKIAQSVAQPSLAKLMHNFNREKSCPNVWTTKK
jgi:hypothetical protein